MAAARNIEVNGTVRNDSVNAPIDDNATLARHDVNLNRSAAVRRCSHHRWNS